MFSSRFNLRSGKIHFIAKYKDTVVEFDVSKFFTKSSCSFAHSDDPERTEILNLYINEYGIGKKLIDLYEEAYNAIMSMSNTDVDIYVYRIVDLFDYDKYMTLIRDAGYEAPTDLADELSASKVHNGRITEDQTYTKREYLEMLPYIGVVKAIAPIYAADVRLNPGKYGDGFELVLIGYKLLQYPFMENVKDKIYRFIERHIQSSKSEEELLLAGERYGIAVDDIPVRIFGAISMKLFMCVDISRDVDDAFIIKKMFSAVTTGTSTSSTKKSINFKRLSVSQDSGDTEGWAESSRQTSVVPLDENENFNFIASDRNACYRDLTGKDIPNHDDLLEASRFLTAKVGKGHHPIARFSIELLKLISWKILPIDAIPFLRRENIVNMLIVAAVYMRENGLEKLSTYMLLLYDIEESIKIPETINHVSRQLKDELLTIYPYTLEITQKTGTIKEERLDIQAINSMVDEFRSENYLMLVGDKAHDVAVPYKEIKNDIATLMLLVHGKRGK